MGRDVAGLGFRIGKGDEKRTGHKRLWRREGCRDHNAIETILGRKGLQMRHMLARPFGLR